MSAHAAVYLKRDLLVQRPSPCEEASHMLEVAGAATPTHLPLPPDLTKGDAAAAVAELAAALLPMLPPPLSHPPPARLLVLQPQFSSTSRG